MNSRRNSNHRRRKFSLPVAAILGFMPLTGKIIADVRSLGWSNGLKNSVGAVIPYNPYTRQWSMADLGMGLYPIIGGILVHKIIGGWFGINRALARMGVPYVRL